ncbi:putative P450 monooxygenase [Fusarium austroafricanum]|uniref:Putative P450 monooxygenase n=1 Tax=Fusarium austroafricanum TaxID=2364996 RepID=A0A8H4NM27_9HYPO|nr:putative P450 monooxygenase [Fusarium austroafricanum]
MFPQLAVIRFSEETYLLMWLCGIVLVLPLLLVLRVRYRKGLRQIPGPFLASFSQLDRLLTAASGFQQRRHIDYHRKYGSLVRVGPNHVSFSDADLIPQVYGISSKFVKSNFYSLFDVRNKNGQANSTVFSVRDLKQHRASKRQVAHAFSMSAMIELEPMTDDCIKILQDKLDNLDGRELDFGEWLHWYAFDVITSVTFSNRMGFMQEERDIAGIISAIEGRLNYNSVVGEMPYLHNFLLGHPLVSWIANWIPPVAKLNSSGYIVQFAATQLERYHSQDKNCSNSRDMLARFKYSRDGEEVLKYDELLTHASSNIFAGSDTTAISLRSMFYYLCRNPHSYKKLLEEIDQFDSRGELSDIISFSEANRMPYLQACMKEAMRMHPAVGQLLERVVPDEGFEISPGLHLPPGTIVGMNPWVSARDIAVYGEDADTFRPERWIEADTAQLKLMERNFMAFGSGARTCIGKNVSLLEMSKLVPQILRLYDVEFANPNSEWTLLNYWFVKQTGLICRVKRRQPGPSI